MNIVSRFLEVAEASASLPAIERPDGSILSYAELLDRCQRAAARFRSLGLQKDDRVIVMLPLSEALFVATVGLSMVGAVSVFVDPTLGRKHSRAVLRDVSAKALIGIPKAHFLRWIMPELRRIPLKLSTRRLRFPSALPLETDSGERLTEPVPVTPEHPSLITFTSGSGGQPRGSLRTHGQSVAQLAQMAHPPEKMACQSDFPGFPIVAFDNLFHGRRLVIPKVPLRLATPQTLPDLIQQMAASRVEMVSGSPRFFRLLADHASQDELPHLKLMFTGGAPIPRHLLDRLASRFPRAKVVVVYGSTESEPVSGLDAQAALTLDGYPVGPPVDGINVQIVPMDTPAQIDRPMSDVALPVGQPGDVVVQGAHVATLYWQDSQGSVIQASDGAWLRMGDVGQLDELGHLTLLGRSHHVAWLKVKTGQIVPHYALEHRLMDAFGVDHAAIVAKDGGLIGLVESADGADCQTNDSVILKWLAEIRSIDSLPLDARHAAKVDYRRLQEEAK